MASDLLEMLALKAVKLSRAIVAAPPRYRDPVEQMLSAVIDNGSTLLMTLAKDAVSRLLASGQPHYFHHRLFTGDELMELANEIAAAQATAHLLGRSLVADQGERERRRDVSEGLLEGCVPNKSGTGHHDEHGHPCSTHETLTAHVGEHHPHEPLTAAHEAALDAHAEKKVAGILSAVASLPGKLVPQRMKDAVQRIKGVAIGFLQRRYGERATGIILKVALLSAPVPVPGSQPLAIAASLVVAEAVRAYAKLRGKTEAVERELTAAEISAAAEELLAMIREQLTSEWGEISESVTPNKTGPGCHDEHGKPASCGREEAKAFRDKEYARNVGRIKAKLGEKTIENVRKFVANFGSIGEEHLVNALTASGIPIERARRIPRWLVYAGVLQSKESAGKVTYSVYRESREPSPLHRLLEDAPLPSLEPNAALDFFRALIPTLGTNPLFLPNMQRTAFTLAVAVEHELLKTVQEVIAERLRTGEISTGARAVQTVLDAAGVTPTNRGYSDMVWRTNAMDALVNGIHIQQREEADVFPVWRYSNPDDSRSRKTHAARNGNYYPANVTMDQVRGNSIAEKARCRCVPVPITRRKWAKLRAQGARVEEPWPDVVA